MIREPFSVEIDEEGVCRVVGYTAKTMTFTTRDFGHFLTRFVEAVNSDNDDEHIDVEMD